MARGVHFLAQDFLNSLIDPRFILQTLDATINPEQIIDTSTNAVKSIGNGIKDALGNLTGF